MNHPRFFKKIRVFPYTFKYFFSKKSSNRDFGTNPPLWPPIYRHKSAITPKWFNSLDTNSKLMVLGQRWFWIYVDQNLGHFLGKKRICPKNCFMLQIMYKWDIILFNEKFLTHLHQIGKPLFSLWNGNSEIFSFLLTSAYV